MIVFDKEQERIGFAKPNNTICGTKWDIAAFEQGVPLPFHTSFTIRYRTWLEIELFPELNLILARYNLCIH